MRLLKTFQILPLILLSPGCAYSPKFYSIGSQNLPTGPTSTVPLITRTIPIAAVQLPSKPFTTVNVFADKSPTMAWVNTKTIASGLNSIVNAVSSAKQSITVNVYSMEKYQLEGANVAYTSLSGAVLPSRPAAGSYIQTDYYLPNLFNNLSVQFSANDSSANLAAASALLTSQIISGGIVNHNQPVGRAGLLRVLEQTKPSDNARAIFLFISDQDDKSSYYGALRSDAYSVSQTAQPDRSLLYPAIRLDFTIAQYSTNGAGQITKVYSPNNMVEYCNAQNISRGLCAIPSGGNCSSAQIAYLQASYGGALGTCTVRNTTKWYYFGFVDGDSVSCSGSIKAAGQVYASFAAYGQSITGMVAQDCNAATTPNYRWTQTAATPFNGPIPSNVSDDAYLDSTIIGALNTAYSKPENYMVGAILHDSKLDASTSCANLTNPGEAYGTKYMNLLTKLNSQSNAVSICQNDYAKIFQAAQQFATGTMELAYSVMLSAGERVARIGIQRGSSEISVADTSYSILADGTLQFSPGVVEAGDQILLYIAH